MNNARFLVLAGAGAALAVVAGVSVNLFRSDDRGGDWVDSETDTGAAQSLEELLEWSTVVVTAEYLGESQEKVDLASPVDGRVYSHRLDRVMRFETHSVLRTDRAIGDSLTVRAALSLTTWGENAEQQRTQEFGAVALEQGHEYALFLTRFSESTGDTLGPAGPIAIAEIVDERLRFLAGGVLADDEDEQSLLGIAPSLEEVVALIADPPPTREWPTVDPNSPAPVYGERLTLLADGLQEARTSNEVDALLLNLELGPGQIHDRSICEKVEIALATSGWAKDLQCS